MEKSTVQQIRDRFDKEVERFSNLGTGQVATIDAPLAMELIASAAAATVTGSGPGAKAVLDVGCGAGNYTIKLLQKLPGLAATLVDLSQPMLDRAVERVLASGASAAYPIQGDIREIMLPDGGFDIILAAAVLHHLRTDAEWQAVFARFHSLLRPGGSVWIFDMIEHSNPAVQKLMWERYGQYLVALKDTTYRDHVFDYIKQEDTPRSLNYQLDLLRQAGFARIEVLHKNGPFAAFGAIKDP